MHSRYPELRRFVSLPAIPSQIAETHFLRSLLIFRLGQLSKGLGGAELVLVLLQLVEDD